MCFACAGQLCNFLRVFKARHKRSAAAVTILMAAKRKGVCQYENFCRNLPLISFNFFWTSFSTLQVFLFEIHINLIRTDIKEVG